MHENHGRGGFKKGGLIVKSSWSRTAPKIQGHTLYMVTIKPFFSGACLLEILLETSSLTRKIAIELIETFSL